MERVEDVYSFSHLTLQEYLTARYIHAHGQISQMAEKYLTDERWREVFVLTSGLMVDRGSDELLLEMHKAAKQYARHPKVKALLKWADQATAGSSGNFKSTAKRAVAISIANVIGGSFFTLKARLIANFIATNIDNKIIGIVINSNKSSDSDINDIIRIIKDSGLDIFKARVMASTIDRTIAITLEQSSIL